MQLDIRDDARRFLAQTIQEAGGHEVFFAGRAEEGEVVEVEALARGNETSVPALIEQLSGWDLAIHNHPDGNLTPSDADLDIASELGNRSIGFLIVNNEATEWTTVVKPFPKRDRVLVDVEEVGAFFAPGGPLSECFPGFEPRDGQRLMAISVARAFNDDLVLAVEAGTGIGKSFAYLVPAILWSVGNRSRVIVSTNTINLQEQLVGKDLPFLARVMPVPFEFSHIKGKGNYACLRKAAELGRGDASLFDTESERKVVQDLVAWTRSTPDGSRSDLGMVVPMDTWEKIMCETDRCLRLGCAHYQDCFYFRARRRASRSHILVVNHHLFFADLAVRRETGNYSWDIVLPGCERVIFDEAHNLEGVASEYFGVSFSRTGILKRMGRMVSARDPSKGAIPFLVGRLRSRRAPVADEIEASYVGAMDGIRQRVDEAFQMMREEIRAALDCGRGRPTAEGSPPGARGRPTAEGGPPGAQGRPTAEGSPPGARGQPTGEPGLPGAPPPVENREAKIRWTDDDEARPLWSSLEERLGEIEGEIRILHGLNNQALRSLRSAEGILPVELEELELELTSAESRLGRLLESLEFFADRSEPGHVRWVEAGESPHSQGNVVCRTSPILVADDLRAGVYDPIRSVVLTSATLSVDQRIDYLAGRLGLDQLSPERFLFEGFPSPFDYESQALVLIPEDMPDPASAAYESELEEWVLRALEVTGGRAFVLFTSYALLGRIHARLEEKLTALGIEPLRQGKAPRTDLLNRFRRCRNGALFGTDSFWEGVDVKGEALEMVIITRLPFKVPSDPVQVARVEEIEGRGGHPFLEYTVPQAVLRFKQGFGRLIRSRSDRGVVLVLDRRIVTRHYGRLFLRSLPPVRAGRGRSADVLRLLREFFSGARRGMV